MEDTARTLIQDFESPYPDFSTPLANLTNQRVQNMPFSTNEDSRRYSTNTVMGENCQVSNSTGRVSHLKEWLMDFENQQKSRSVMLKQPLPFTPTKADTIARQDIVKIPINKVRKMKEVLLEFERNNRSHHDIHATSNERTLIEERMNTVMGVRNWLNDMEAKQNQTPEKNPRSKIELDMPMSKVTPLRVWLQEIERQNRENAERFKTKCTHNHGEFMSTHQLGYRQLRLKNKVREITNWLEQIEQKDSEKGCKVQTHLIGDEISLYEKRKIEAYAKIQITKSCDVIPEEEEIVEDKVKGISVEQIMKPNATDQSHHNLDSIGLDNKNNSLIPDNIQMMCDKEYEFRKVDQMNLQNENVSLLLNNSYNADDEKSIINSDERDTDKDKVSFDSEGLYISNTVYATDKKHDSISAHYENTFEIQDKAEERGSCCSPKLFENTGIANNMETESNMDISMMTVGYDKDELDNVWDNKNNKCIEWPDINIDPVLSNDKDWTGPDELLTAHNLLESNNAPDIADDSVVKVSQEDSKFTTTITPNNSLENFLLNDDISEGSSVIDHLMNVNNVSDSEQELSHLNKDSGGFLTKSTPGVIAENDDTLSINKYQMLISQVDNASGKEIKNTVISRPKSLLQKQVSFISPGEKKQLMISIPKGNVNQLNNSAKRLKNHGLISKLFKRFKKIFIRKSKERSKALKKLDLQDKCLTKPFNPNDSDYAKLLDNDVVCSKKSSDISKLSFSCTDSTVFVPPTVLQEQNERNYLPASYEEKEKNEEDQLTSYRNNESPQSLAAAFEQGMSPVHSTASTVDFSFYGDSLIPNNYSCNNVSQHVGWLQDMFATPTKSREGRIDHMCKMY